MPLKAEEAVCKDSLFYYFLLKNFNPTRCYFMITTLNDSDSPDASVTRSM